MAAAGLAADGRKEIFSRASFGARLVAIARRLDAAPSREIVLQAVVLVCLAVLTRGARIGDPAITGDEQFYLLVGDRIWQGALPFVDIWDRKPIGLFLLYALFRPLSPDGIMAYQVAASLFAAMTALVLSRITRHMTGPVAATAAGALYLVYLPIIGGAGGQSPVFYDLFTASAALVVVRCIGGADRAALWRHGLAAMLLTGIAIQVKYTALFEGIAFGLTMLWLYWSLDKSWRVGGYALSLIGVALLPTAVAFGFYAISGHAMAFVSANFLAIFQKTRPADFSDVRVFLVPSALKMAPMLLVSTLAIVAAFLRHRASAVFVFALLWSALALAEFFALGRYSDHYAIPLLMPLAVIVAVLFDWVPFAIAASSLMILALALTPDAFSRKRTREDEAKIAALTRAVALYTRKGCLYVYDGPPILYLTTHACLPTRYVFPSHLADADEAVATDASASMARLLRDRPAVIVTANRSPTNPRNHDTATLLASGLASGYRLAQVLPDIGSRRELIYVRNDLGRSDAIISGSHAADSVRAFDRVAPAR